MIKIVCIISVAGNNEDYSECCCVYLYLISIGECLILIGAYIISIGEYLILDR